MLAWLSQIISKFKKNAVVPPVVETEEEVCCPSGFVKIAYRGVSDDRLYLAEGRKWRDVRFFKPNGLKVFCSECRRRLL